MKKEIREINAPAIDLIADILDKHMDAILGEVRIRFKQIKVDQSSEPAEPVKVPSDVDDRLIDAASSYAEKFDGDDRQDIKTDVINAFYQGARYAHRYVESAEPVKVPSDDLAHEIWAAAQTVPGEGIEDAVERVAALLARYGQPSEPEKDAAGYTLGPISDGGMDPRNEQSEPVKYRIDTRRHRPRPPR